VITIETTAGLAFSATSIMRDSSVITSLLIVSLRLSIADMSLLFKKRKSDIETVVIIRQNNRASNTNQNYYGQRARENAYDDSRFMVP
jgi:phospholipase C